MDSFMLPAEEIRAHTSAAEPQAKEAELLDGQTAHAYITRKLDQMGESDVCAVFMADIDNIPDITAELGSLKEADIEDRVGDIISSMFYGSDIVSRIGRDEYLIFTFWEADRQKLAEKTELLCDRLRFKAGTDSEFEVTVCVGVYMAKGSGLNFENLFGHAAAALYEAKNNGSGSYCILTNAAEAKIREKEDTGLIAVLFMEHREQEQSGITEKYDVDTTAARRIEDLEQELHESQNDLKSTIGELETVNEELQAANEELLTANEELQSSNEELQSVNEELYTVNTEYQQKLDELTMLTNDLSNFLSSTMIGILFVDSSLNIRKFTEYVGREFQLMEHDVGRSLQIFAHSFPEEDIIKDAKNVLKDLVPIDREVTAMNGRYYTLRIAPYRTTENSIRGLVITIIDSLGAKD